MDSAEKVKPSADTLPSTPCPLWSLKKNHDHLETARDLGYLVLSGNASEDVILEKAGIQKAVGLIAILGVDAENVFLILSARQMNPKIQIVAWATVHEAEKKLYRAGADRVLSSFELGGLQVVQSMIRPNVMDFLNQALDIENEELQLDQILVQDDSPISGKALKDCDFRNSLKVMESSAMGNITTMSAATMSSKRETS